MFSLRVADTEPSTLSWSSPVALELCVFLPQQDQCSTGEKEKEWWRLWTCRWQERVTSAGTMSLSVMLALDKAQLWDRGECWGSVHALNGKTSFFLYLYLLCISGPKCFLELNLSAKWNCRPEQNVLRTGSVKEFDVGLEDYRWKSVMAQVQSLLAGFL